MLVHSMWEATANPRPSYPRLKGDKETDVVIIGGGFTGLSTAYHLRKHNINAVVLEKERVGFGASGRNGGEILTGYLGSMEDWAKKKGLEAAREMWQLSLDAIDLIESIIKEHDIKCDFVRNGHFYAAYKRKHLDRMKRNQEYMAKYLNYEHIEIIEESELYKELNTTFYYGGEVDKKSAHYHPLNYTLGLAEAVAKLNGVIYEETAALKIKQKRNQIIVHTEEGRVIAKKLVFATNAYIDDVNDKIKRSVVPVESIMIATEPLSEELMQDLIRNNRAVFDSKNLLYYFRRTADHRMAFGGSGRASSKRDLMRIFDNLHAGMLKVFPQLKDAKIEYQWGGKVGFTKSMLPYIGQLDKDTYFAFGYGGHGAAMATMLGKEMADAIAAGQSIDNPLKVERLKPILFHSHHAKGVSFVKTYKQFKDLIS